MGNKRFFRLLSESKHLSGTEIWVDLETGVKYLFHSSGYAGGMTPLLDKDGKPDIATEYELNEYRYR